MVGTQVMNKFGKTSTARLETCSANLQLVCQEAIKRTPFFADRTRQVVVPDLIVICGHRTKAEQQKAYDHGMSKVQWPDSKHNTDPSIAVDIGPYIKDLPGHIPWSNKMIWKSLHSLMMEVSDDLDIPLRSGIDWNGDGVIVDIDPTESFWDAPHYEEII